MNVLAAPDGHQYTFRYAARYIDTSAREQWSNLKGKAVAVVFSFQQEAKYHEPAFIPIRLGYVISTSVEGDAHFVTFRTTDYASLPAPPLADGREQPHIPVLDFSTALRDVTSTPYKVSASLGPYVADWTWEHRGDQSVLFSRTATYLARTETFKAARFVRVLGLKPTGQPDTTRIRTTDDDPAVVLHGGRTYDLEFFHAQPVAPSTPQPFIVDVDDVVLATIGRGQFDVASRYDRVSIQITTAASTSLEDRSTVLAIDPGAGVYGPRVVMPIRVVSAKGRTVGLAGAQALSLIAIALAGTFTHWALGARLSLAIFGALAAAGIGLFGGQILRVPALPGSSSVTAGGSEGAGRAPSAQVETRG